MHGGNLEFAQQADQGYFATDLPNPTPSTQIFLLLWSIQSVQSQIIA